MEYHDTKSELSLRPRIHLGEWKVLEVSSLPTPSVVYDTNCQVRLQGTRPLRLLKTIKLALYVYARINALTMPSFLGNSRQDVFGQLYG
jgi:hypothetical protein